MKVIQKIIIVFLLLFVILAIAFLFSFPFMAVNKPIQSSNLVVEGWLTGNELEQVLFESQQYELQRLFIVGKHYPSNENNFHSLKDFKKEQFVKWYKPGVLLLTNSSLIIDLSKISGLTEESIFSISVKASDTQKNDIYAHFNIVVDGKLIGDTFVNDSLKFYSFDIADTKKEYSTLAIFFDNDCHTITEARNLHIESIAINNNLYTIDETFAFITRNKSLLSTGFNSDTEETKQYLVALGVNPQIIELAEFEEVDYNQTLAAALSIKNLLQNQSIANLNVTSSGLHGRRTYMTYQKLLGKEVDIGIINAEIKMLNRSNWYKSSIGIQVMMNEFFSIIFAWFYLTFYY